MNTTRDYHGALKRAFQDIFILPGSRLLLKPMRFSDDYRNKLSGITVLPYQNSATIDGSLTVDGDSVIFRDMEITFSGWSSRQTEEAGNTPSDIPTGKAVTINAPDCKFINCIIHNVAGIGLWSPALSAEFYGCIVYNIGWQGPDRGHGHGLYIQNQAGLKKTIKHSIIFDCFGWGIHAYSSTGNNLQDMDIIGNICFRAGSLSGVAKPNILVGADRDRASRITIRGNRTFGGSIGVQFFGAGAAEVILEYNYCPDGVNNSYIAASESGNHWGPDIGDQLFIIQNEYDPDRLHLAIYNQALADIVDVDVSAFFSDGQIVDVRNVQDYFTDVQSLIITGGAIAVDMQVVNRTVVSPIGWTAPPKTFPQFGAFVIRKTS